MNVRSMFISDFSGNIFYMSEYRDTLLSLVRKFHMSKHTKYGCVIV